MKIDLAGQNVLVTGASRGIGRAIAEALAAAGAAVGVHCHRSRAAAAEIVASLGGGARVFQADLAEAAACRRLFAEAVAVFGRVHGLVNNAGVALATPIDAEAEEWAAVWDRAQAVNLRAPGLLCREALLHFRAHGGGRIVNVASRAAFRGDTPEYLAYAASKGGIVSLTRSIARGFGKQGVTAFLIAPGFVRTEMAQESIDLYGEDFVLRDLALDRLTEPRDVAPFVVLCLSALADHATGATFDVNAGSYVH